MTQREKGDTGDRRTPPTLLQVVDALVIADDPILDQRFQEAIAMHPDPAARATLAALPPRVAEGSRLTRRAGVEWERIAGQTLFDEEFKVRAERYLLETLLDAAESQIRLKAFMASSAPTKEVRDLIDAALAVHRELTDALRDALRRLPDPSEVRGGRHHPPVGVEGLDANLRGAVEAGIRALAGAGKKVRCVVVSANALRHLRDQGALPPGATSILGAPVEVDLSWQDSAFALVTYDAVPLEEILRGDKQAPGVP